MAEKKNQQFSDQIRKSLERAARQARKMGGRVAHAMAETPEFISLQRNDRALRSEMNEAYQTIGKRVLLLHKKSKSESPFSRYPVIRRELNRLEHLQSEYRDNKVKLSEVKREMRKGR